MNKEQLIENVKSNLSSIFTKEDVIKMLSQLDTTSEEKKPVLFDEGEEASDIIKVRRCDLVDAIHDAVTGLQYSCDTMIDPETAQFSLDGNTVILDTVDLDLDVLTNEIEESILEYITNLD